MTVTRRLILLRHAKSSHAHRQPDHERPLNDRGRRDAPRVGAELARLGWTPDLVISSDATRTRQTWKGISGPLGFPEDGATFTSSLYLTGIDEIRACAAQWPDGAKTVLCLGHNFGWQEAVATLAGGNEELTTCNAACLEGTGDRWVDALNGRFSLVRMVRPRDLPHDG